MQLQQRSLDLITEKKSEKDAAYFHPKDNHGCRILAKREKKNHKFKHKLKTTFLFNFLRLSEEVEKPYLATSRDL